MPFPCRGPEREIVMVVKGSCHCGATRFELASAPESVTACTCSICSKRGGLWAYYAPDEVAFASDDARTEYRWGSKLGTHNFCGRCGCTTYGEFPDFSTGEPDFDRPRISINARLLDDFDLGQVPVTVLDGRNLW